MPGEKKKDGRPKTTADKRAEAHDFCRALEIAENNAKAGTLTEQAAKRLIAEIVERSSGEALKTHTVTDWLEEWQAGKADAKAKTTAGRYAQVVREFLKSLGRRSKLSLSHITPKDIRAFRDSQLAVGNSNTPPTTLCELSALRLMPLCGRDTLRTIPAPLSKARQ